MRILTALDRSEYAEIVLEHALDEAVQRDARDLHFVTVVPDPQDFEAARVWLDTAVRDGLDTFGLSGVDPTLHVLVGSPGGAIAAHTHSLAADLLVIGRFDVPSSADAVIDVVDCPTLVVGIDGTVLEPQCPACVEVRRTSEGERLFCPEHSGDRVPDLAMRVPMPPDGIRIW